MHGTIYDFATLPRLAPEPVRERARAVSHASSHASMMAGHVLPRLVGVISNPRSHHNHAKDATMRRRPGVLLAAPRTRAELRDVLADYARAGIGLLVIDGGDGTIRDVLTCGGAVWGSGMWPEIAILPAGKTNALAVDLGVPQGWTLDDVLQAASTGGIVERPPIEIERCDAGGSGANGTVVRGFFLGAGAFVAATELAQRTHRMGAFNGIAVGLAVAWGLAKTFFGGPDSSWRRGSRMDVRFGADARPMHGAALSGDAARFIMVASTLDRLPVGIKAFGTPRPGLKMLVVDAPAHHLARTALPLILGSENPRLEALGYHRIDARRVDVNVENGFILDGEQFPGGRYTLRRGAPLRFVTP